MKFISLAHNPNLLPNMYFTLPLIFTRCRHFLLLVGASLVLATTSSSYSIASTLHTSSPSSIQQSTRRVHLPQTQSRRQPLFFEQCYFCCYVFKHRTAFRKHVKAHLLSKKNYKCKQCHKAFHSKKSLHQHTESKHPTFYFSQLKKRYLAIMHRRAIAWHSTPACSVEATVGEFSYYTNNQNDVSQSNGITQLDINSDMLSQA